MKSERGVATIGFKKEISTEIEIFASVDRIWQILMDFAAYPNWNPYIKEISGEAKVGSKIKVHMKPEWEKKGVIIHPRIIRLEPGKELTWKGSFFFPGLLDGEHSLILEEISGRKVRFIQKEIFNGIAIPIISTSWSIEKGTVRSFGDMNNALKKRAERVR
ncbi:MAG: SRPBCC domain-containing protein [Methanosarcina sp.]|uniref:SRPBCC domain-containing protein n=1 Tax=Methanosarcina sp. TaxID=2213 RepID=UPI00262B026C|nr:SRPBCC domain-containing protein [Methanosarcina sp.]MDD3246469.1 SRPBCC domain-containing protein [Methanosarcina sp.]MDD4249552.1 SRPBCC domain-containing protein [Methanosarcina sp.]